MLRSVWYRKLQLKLGGYERKILHIGAIKFRPENYISCKDYKKMLILKRDCYIDLEKISPKIGHGAAAPLIDRDRRP